MSERFQDIESAVRDYVLGNLSESDSEEFEELLVLDPKVAEMVVSVQRINLGLENVETSNKLPQNGILSSLAKRALAIVSVPVPAYIWLGVSLMVMPLLLFMESGKFEADSINLVGFETTLTRGSHHSVILDLNNYEGVLGFFFKVSSVEHEYHRVTLLHKDNKEVAWQSKKFSMFGNAHMLVLPERLKKNTYEVRLEGFSPDGDPEQIKFCNYRDVCK